MSDDGVTDWEQEIIDRALVIAPPWIDRILAGTKTWEMRSRDTRIRGWIGLIRKGAKQIVGAARIVDTHGPLSAVSMYAALDRHRIERERLPSVIGSGWTYAWVLADVQLIDPPVSYSHPRGAVVWVKLKQTEQANLGLRLASAASWPVP